MSFLTLTLWYNCNSQTYLVFDKPGIVKRFRFYPGDLIKFKYNDNEIIEGSISKLDPKSLEIDQYAVYQIDSITHLYMNKQGAGAKTRGVLSTVLLTAGIGYLSIDAFNNAINGRQVFTEGTLIFSSVAIASGLFLKLFQKRVYRIKNNRRLFVIDM